MMRITKLLKDTSGRLINLKLAGFVVLLFSVCSVNAQSVTITGTVTSAADGTTLPMANVVVKGTANGVSTDLDGNYAISASANDVLVFSYIGYAAQEVKVGTQTTINVSLAADAKQLDEVVVIGYGTSKKSDLTGSVAVVNVADAKKTVSYDMAKMLQGQVAGVTVQSSGEPGGFVNIKIRGISSFVNNNPLFVIDGMIVDNPYDFNPGEIETMQVLKDASSAAIYGVRGANGVIIITTKKGKAGKISVNYKSSIGFQTVPKKLGLTNREQYQKITNQAYLNAGLAILPGNDPNSPSYINNVDTNWQDEAYRTGQLQNHTLSFTGGTDLLNYSMNVDYFKNTSYIDTPQAYERTSTTMNIGGTKGKFKFGGKLGYTNSNKENFNSYSGASAMINLIQAIPTMPVYDENRLGGYGGTDNLTQRAITLNVIGYNRLLTNRGTRNRFIGNVWGELEIVKGLKYTMRVSADRADVSNRLFVPPSDLGWYYITTNAESSLDVNNDYTTRTVFDNLLNYDLTVGKHHVDALAGYVQEDNKYYNHWSRGVGYDNNEISNIEYADDISGGEYRNRETRLSVLGRVNYTFDDTYLFTVNFRQDKSSKFSTRFNAGNYYSVSAAYKIHNDIKLPEWWDTLKLRGGYGVLGNNTVPLYNFETTVNPFASYDFNNTTAPGTIATATFDPNIKWEDTTTANVALEFGMFKNKLQFSAEYYVRTSDGLLLQKPLPYSTGAFPASVWTNAAKVENRGFEFTVSYNNDDHDFKYGISANAGTLKNKVLSISGDGTPLPGINAMTEVGRSIGEIYAYQVQGIFQNQAEIDGAATQGVVVKPGDIRFKDVNGDGQITDDDRTYQGTTIPKVSYGFNFNANYKNFDFSFFLQGNAGNKIYNGTYNSLMIGGLLNHSTDELNYWTPENTNTNVPRPDVLETNQNARGSSRFVEKGDYLKLQNIQIGYSIPLKDTKIIQKVRLYVSGQNIYTFTKYRGYDADFISDGLLSRGFEAGSFPNPKTVIFGLEVNF